jgi:hypothetical protein
MNDWYEWQLLMATVTVLPAVLLLLVAAATGRIARSESVKYVVLLGPEDDYWDTSSVTRTDDGDEEARP